MSLKQDNTKGTATVTYLALNLSINCRVTSLPSLVLTDAQKTYALGSAAKTLDFTDSTINPMTQTPLCNYTWTTNTYSWTNLPSWITTSTSTSGHANAVLNFAQTGTLAAKSGTPYAITLSIAYNTNDFLAAANPITKTLNFSIVVSFVCPEQTANWVMAAYPVVPATITYNINTGMKEWPIPAWSLVNDQLCSETETLTMTMNDNTALPTYVKFDSATRKF